MGLLVILDPRCGRSNTNASVGLCCYCKPVARCHPHLGRVFPRHLTSSRKSSQTWPEVHIHGGSKSHQTAITASIGSAQLETAPFEAFLTGLNFAAPTGWELWQSSCSSFPRAGLPVLATTPCLVFSCLMLTNCVREHMPYCLCLQIYALLLSCRG